MSSIFLKKQLKDKDNEISATKKDVCTIEKELQETDEIRKTIMSKLSICDEKSAALENEIQLLSLLLAVSEKIWICVRMNSKRGIKIRRRNSS